MFVVCSGRGQGGWVIKEGVVKFLLRPTTPGVLYNWIFIGPNGLNPTRTTAESRKRILGLTSNDIMILGHYQWTMTEELAVVNAESWRVKNILQFINQNVTKR